MSTTEIVRYEAMVYAIAQCHAIDEVKDIRDKAMALELYAKQARNTDAERKASEIRLRAERRTGELLKELRDIAAVESASRKAFIETARRAFKPTKRIECAVCNRHYSLTQAHHITPLYLQAAAGYKTPDQSHVWLCPTHHAAVHILFDYMQSGFDPSKASETVCATVYELNHFQELEAVQAIVQKAFHLSTSEAQWNVDTLRKAANARMRHADALDAWNANRVEDRIADKVAA